jgi:hypothetical protein
MPTFCRHNRLIQNCPICTREQEIELRPIISSSAPRVGHPATSAPRERRAPASSTRTGARGRNASRLTVRRLSRGSDDGYSSPLVPGLRSSEDAERLAEEIALGAGRLKLLSERPPGLYAEVADEGGDVEERTWLAFLIAYLSPVDEDDPFAGIRAARTSWHSGTQPELEHVETGPRTAYDPARGSETPEAYRAWAGRAGSQAAAFTGEPSWSPERRFARAFERLALPGLRRDARYDLLVTLGRLGVYELRPASLQFGGDNEVTLAAKRALGIGDPLLLERRASELARASEVPLEALDVGFYNWERGERASLGLGPESAPDPDALAATRAALGL